MGKTVKLERRGGVAEITLDRPDAANSLNVELARDLFEAALRCDEDPTVRAILLHGSGERFCAGGDLKSFATAGDDLPRYVKEVTTYLHAAIARFHAMNAPLVAAVHGSAAGAGMSLACAADFVLAGESARFTMAYTRIGLVPDGSSTYFLERIVGFRRALELAITNRVLSARDAAEWGIVTRVVPDADVVAEGRRFAEELAKGPTVAFGTTKRLLRGGWREGLESQMDEESRAIAEAVQTEDGREGVRAFLEKRPPKFSGR